MVTGSILVSRSLGGLASVRVLVTGAAGFIGSNLVDLDAHCAQPHQHPAAQPLGRGVVAAAPGNQRLDLPLEAVLAQTGRALVQVHADLASIVVGYLTVEVEVNLLDHLSTVGLVWTTAAHAAPPSARTADGGAA